MAQLHPRAPLLSAPTVVAVSDDCEKNKPSKQETQARYCSGAKGAESGCTEIVS